MGRTEIEWATDVWNPVTGCTKVSPGCKFCYAERVTERWGREKFTDVRLHADRLDAPLLWRKPRRVFVNSMSDLFHERVPTRFLAEVFDVIAASPHHVFQVLTKRPERMRVAVEEEIPYYAGMKMPGDTALSTSLEVGAWPLPNLWAGVSVEDQPRTSRIDWLLKTPAAVRFLSIEPLLEPVDIRKWLVIPKGLSGYLTVTEKPINWVIVGGESGGSPERALVERCETSVWANVHRANRDACEGCGGTGWSPKPEALAWVRALRDQCVGAGVPFFFKQWGGVTPKAGGCILDGKVWHEFPDGPGRR